MGIVKKEQFCRKWKKYCDESSKKRLCFFFTRSLFPYTILGVPDPPKGLHSPSLTWNLKRMVSKRNLLFQGAIFRFHVKLWEGKRVRRSAVFFGGWPWLWPIFKKVLIAWLEQWSKLSLHSLILRKKLPVFQPTWESQRFSITRHPGPPPEKVWLDPKTYLKHRSPQEVFAWMSRVSYLKNHEISTPSWWFWDPRTPANKQSQGPRAPLFRRVQWLILRVGFLIKQWRYTPWTINGWNIQNHPI